MKSIFYDLETTDLATTGQILNFCFTLVDETWEVLETLSSSIKLNRLVLPKPKAIKINRINVMDHQSDPYAMTEVEAMVKIERFVRGISERADSSGEPVRLIGYNSNKFDIKYLRTCMIRNGISPYWGKAVQCKDLLHMAQRLATCEQKFLDKIDIIDQKTTLKLENLCSKFGLMTGDQTHESRDDVNLTIKLAKYLAETYGADIRNYVAYEPRLLEEPGSIVKRVFPVWKDSSTNRLDDVVNVSQFAYLCGDKNYALWINLNKYQAGEGKNSVFYFNRAMSQFYVDDTYTPTEEIGMLAAVACEEFSEMNTRNFWPPIDCDVEAHIYKLPFEGIDALHEAIHRNNIQHLVSLKNIEANHLYSRFAVNNVPVLSGKNLQYFDRYCKYRYGGKMKISNRDVESVSELTKDDFHPTFETLLGDIELERVGGTEKDYELMAALELYFHTSEINVRKPDWELVTL
jgi:DNA polymerase III epsilon subunit-like protein